MTEQLPIYSKETVGKLLRRLNLICVNASEAGDIQKARTSAAFSMSIEQALEFVKPHREPDLPIIRCTCYCSNTWDIAFVPWSFKPECAYRCSKCKKWCQTVQMFLHGSMAPASVSPAPPFLKDQQCQDDTRQQPV